HWCRLRSRSTGAVRHAGRDRVGLRFPRTECRWRARHARRSRERLQDVLIGSTGRRRESMHRASLAAAILLTTPGLLHAQQVFRAEVDLVHFGVVVTDRSGAPVLGLTPDDFEIVEDGKPQAIKFFAGGEPESSPPLHLGFMIDNSGSMVDDIREV